AAADTLGEQAQRLSGVVHEHQDEPADGGVEHRSRIEGPGVCLAERDVGDALRGAPLLGDTDGIAVEIYPGDRTVGADEGADQEADVAGPAANVKNMHARADSGATQHPFGQRLEYLGLFDQSFILGTAAAKGIIGVLHVCGSLTSVTRSPAHSLSRLCPAPAPARRPERQAAGPARCAPGRPAVPAPR